MGAAPSMAAVRAFNMASRGPRPGITREPLGRLQRAIGSVSSFGVVCFSPSLLPFELHFSFVFSASPGTQVRRPSVGVQVAGVSHVAAIRDPPLFKLYRVQDSGPSLLEATTGAISLSFPRFVSSLTVSARVDRRSLPEARPPACLKL